MQDQLTRRTLIASAAFVPLASLTAQAVRGLTAAQRKTLDAFVDRLIPSDELGPGALEAGAGEYIDRCLGDYLKAEKQAIAEGLAALDAYAKSLHGAELASLPADQRDAVLTDIEAGKGIPNAAGLFNRIRRLTLEGMFGDPHWGGNRSFAGWDLIRYPGPRLVVAAEDQKLDAKPAPYRKSAWGETHDGH